MLRFGGPLLFTASCVLATACSSSNPWEDIEYVETGISAVSVFRAPDNRLCGFLDGRYNPNATMLSPGALTCDDGALGAPTVVYQATTTGRLLPAPVSPAMVFGNTLVRFDPNTKALVTATLPPEVTGPAVAGVDGQGRLFVNSPSGLVRRELDGARTVLLAGTLTGGLLIAPDERIFVRVENSATPLSELTNGRLEPVVSCPNPTLGPNCVSPLVHGFDESGALYLSALGAFTDAATQVLNMVRVNRDRQIERLPDGPQRFRPNGGIAPCSVTARGVLVCAYHFEESADETFEENYSNHYEIIHLDPGASAWSRAGKIPGGDSSPYYLAARDGGDCIAGDFSGGASTHILNLRGYHYD